MAIHTLSRCSRQSVICFSNLRRKAAKKAAPARLEALEPRQLLSADVVVEWDDIAINAVRNDRAYPGPGWSSRNLAMVHGAIYDAVNAIDQSYTPYLLKSKAPHWASITAAAATAADAVLSAIYPAQKATFHAALNGDLDEIPDGASKAVGISVGRRAADAMLNARAKDGSSKEIAYQPGTGPGEWQPSWPNYASALGANWGQVKPFVIKDAKQFLPAPFPSLDSVAYAASYNEVKSLGEANSTTRTPDQTEIADFWAYDAPALGTPMVLYNQITQTIAQQEGNTVVDNARLFALTNLAMADAGIATWKAKYIYDIWRPITGIQNGDTDGNPETLGDPDWIPLGAPNPSGPRFTPPFPAYSSGHATFGAAPFNVLAQYYGTDNIQFTATSDELPGVTRSYTSLSQADDENAWSRIYMGVHWSFDRISGQAEGAALASYIYPRILQPVTKPSHDPRQSQDQPPHQLFDYTTSLSAIDPAVFSTVPLPASTNPDLFTVQPDPLT